jgi:hypothetical protein
MYGHTDVQQLDALTLSIAIAYSLQMSLVSSPDLHMHVAAENSGLWPFKYIVTSRGDT